MAKDKKEKLEEKLEEIIEEVKEEGVKVEVVTEPEVKNHVFEAPRKRR